MIFDSHCAHLKSCVGLRVSAWLFSHPIIPSFYLASNVFSSTLHTRLGPHPLALELTHCICGQPPNLARTHLLRYSRGEALHTAFRDAIQDAFTSIVKNVGFHVSHEQIHLLPPPSLQSFHQ
jgi:hypothetical protein